MAITMKLVEHSSNLAEQGYDPASQTLRVKFKSGAAYDYAGVTAQQYADFLQAESKGSYLAGVGLAIQRSDFISTQG